MPDQKKKYDRFRALHARKGAFVMPNARAIAGATDLPAIRTLCDAVDRPVNVVMGLSGPNPSVADLAEAGVRRIGTGGSLARAALGALIRAGREMREAGTFTYAAEAAPDADVAAMMSQDRGGKRTWRGSGRVGLNPPCGTD